MHTHKSAPLIGTGISLGPALGPRSTAEAEEDTITLTSLADPGDGELEGHLLQPLGRRSLLAAFALAAFLWLCLGDTASAAAPANDDFANAAALSGLPANATGTNVDATTESGEPEHTDFSSVTPGEHSVWWSWTAPSDGDVTVDTCGSNFDTLLAVYTGSSVEALTPVALQRHCVRRLRRNRSQR